MTARERAAFRAGFLTGASHAAGRVESVKPDTTDPAHFHRGFTAGVRALAEAEAHELRRAELDRGLDPQTVLNRTRALRGR